MKAAPIEIIFARKSHWISRWIQSETWSRWSHVGIIDGGHIIESRGIPPFKLILVLIGIIPNSTKLGGVTKTPLSEFLAQYPDNKRAYIDGDINIARKMIGKVAYDAWGIVGIRFKRRIDCDDKMSCSKLLWVTSSALNNKFAYRATPQHILNVSYQLD